MKKIYIKPETLEVNLGAEGMIATSMAVGKTTDEVWTNKKEYSSPWETGDAEEETSGIW
jgi:hypothetical protein